MTSPRPARRPRARRDKTLATATAPLALDAPEPAARLVSLTTDRLTLRPLVPPAGVPTGDNPGASPLAWALQR